ncbi:hypothetical protein G3N55_05965 [Dissulfurirhabdus thermomarina]|uniref:Porin n=1 Tax=Dissulfurirhabdus thermomarina TaxID=1765737 RepID=A0A6N9TSG9_DISTH|nr:hypothetical protein [Dissulfurirhabdus thermomarina]NDY42387.1 hypothetical protein [Dissulfurirhabdus thermomarina]NMX24311.1 hypothetical protein [Dissulfurirhabdus thermomarina]
MRDPKPRFPKWLPGMLALALALAVLAAAAAPARAADDALVDTLVRKGVLTPSEAARIRGEAEAAPPAELPPALQGLKVGVLAYLDYAAGEAAAPADASTSFNRFTLTRGYLTVQKTLAPWLGARITTDIHRDADEDWKVRLKYLYAEIRPGDLGPLTGLKLEIGQGHIPWLDFEEHVNPYRCQGTMAVERAGIFNSADIGVSLRGGFLGRLAGAARRTGNPHYDGRYGSWHVGVYNGSGYHASEKNGNKVLEGRFTLRPLPDLVPGFQLSYLGIRGEGNTAFVPTGGYPDYAVHLGMASFEHPWVIATAQVFTTEGNAQGTYVDALGRALDTGGYSFFCRVAMPVPGRRLALLGRFDHFDADTDGRVARDAGYDMWIAGLSYDFHKGNMLLLAWEATDYGRDSGGKGKAPVPGNRLGDEHKVQAVWQVKF